MDNEKRSIDGFCFIISESNKKKLIPCNLRIPRERIIYEKLTFGQAIIEEIEIGAVPIFRIGKMIGQVTGYKIVGRSLKYIEEYFDPEDMK